MHGALKKKEKDFFPDQMCPLVFLKRNVSDPCTGVVMANSQSVGVKKNKHIHRKVKCAHLVPEPGSR